MPSACEDSVAAAHLNVEVELPSVDSPWVGTDEALVLVGSWNEVSDGHLEAARQRVGI